jgi:hypothetical protein
MTIAAAHSFRRCLHIELYQTSCGCASMAIHGPEQQSTINYDVHVCERDSFGTGSWLRRKSSMLLMHERLTITEKGW